MLIAGSSGYALPLGIVQHRTCVPQPLIDSLSLTNATVALVSQWIADSDSRSIAYLRNALAFALVDYSQCFTAYCSPTRPIGLVLVV